MVWLSIGWDEPLGLVAAGGVFIAGSVAAGLADAALAAIEGLAESLEGAAGLALFFVITPSLTVMSAFSFAALFCLAIERTGSATDLLCSVFFASGGALSATDLFTSDTRAVVSNGVLAGKFVSLTLKL